MRKLVREVDAPHPQGDGLSRREINADLTAMGVDFHSKAGLAELKTIRDDARAKRGRRS